MNTVIGEDVNFKGELVLKGDLRIDGYFKGVIKTNDRVLIGQNGYVISDIYANEIIIGGRLIGDVYAKKRVALLKSSFLEGNIYTKTISIEEGTIFEGNCNIIK